ncbi:MAG: LysR family transcriptional regulator [Gammaproteobacteria bacterium]
MDWNDLKLVLAICRTGTLSGAARSLGVNHSTVFRRINAIEKRLNVRLFDRYPGGYAMTEAGETVLRVAERVDAEVDGLSRQLLGADLRLQGPLRVTSPEGIALKILGPQLDAFCAEHPGIQMDLIITSDALKLSRLEADVAVRVTRKPPENLIGRRVCKFRFAMYASRAYLQRHRNERLEDHRWVLTDDGFDQLPPALWKKKEHVMAQVAFRSNSTIATINSTRQGLGVAPLPCFLGDGDTELVRLSDPPDALTMDLWVLTHPDLRNTARVKVLMTHLIEVLEAERLGFEGTRQ